MSTPTLGFSLKVSAVMVSIKKTVNILTNILFIGFSFYHLPDLFNPFRSVSTASMESGALSFMHDKRSAERQESDVFLTPKPVDHSGWISKRIDKESLVLKSLAPTPGNKAGGRDLKRLRAFLTNVTKDKLHFPSEFDQMELVPSSWPLLDFLCAYRLRVPGYAYPPEEELKIFQDNRGLDYSSLTIEPTVPVKVVELTVGRSTDKEIEAAVKFFQKVYRKNQKIFPSGTVSLDNEEIKIPRSDYLKLVEKRSAGDVQYHSTAPKLEGPGDKWFQFPVKIMIGDGLRWMIIVSWPAEKRKQEPGSYRIWPYSPQKKLVKFLESLPTAVGVGIKNDVPDIERIYTDMNPECSLKMAPYLDISALAVLCGWRFPFTNMSVLSIGIMGGLLDKLSSAADGDWCLPWKRLHKEFQIYAVGDIKFGYISYIVLANILLLDVFPDSDATCFLAECSQFECVEKFCTWINFSLSKLEVWDVPRNQATTREGLVNALRGRLVTIGKHVLESSAPSRVTDWSKLFGKWAPLTYGGPRYISEVRDFLVVQAKALATTCFPGAQDFFKPLDAQKTQYLTFGQTNLRDLDYSKPVPDGLLGLKFHPDSSKPRLTARLETLEAGSMIKLAREQDRNQRLILYEFCRLSPERVGELFQRFNKSGDITEEFWMQHVSVYEDIRIMYFNLYNVEPAGVDWLEAQLTDKVDKLVDTEYAAFNKALGLVENKLKRYRTAKAFKKKGKAIRRVDLLSKLPRTHVPKESAPSSQEEKRLKCPPFPVLKAKRNSVVYKSKGHKHTFSKLPANSDLRDLLRQKAEDRRVVIIDTSESSDESDQDNPDVPVELFNPTVEGVVVPAKRKFSPIKAPSPGPSRSDPGRRGHQSEPPRKVITVPADRTGPNRLKAIPAGYEEELYASDEEVEYCGQFS